MPELTDVERFKRYADATSLHQVISRVETPSPEMLENCSPASLNARLKGKSFISTQRLGKHLLLKAGPHTYLALHFGMTGFLLYRKYPGGLDEPERLRVCFKNGYRLLFFCRRKLGKIGMASDAKKFAEAHGLGPDALRLSEEEFIKIFRRRRGMIKQGLMDQKTLAGLGNILSDEILFQAGIHPREKIEDLSPKTLEQLYEAMTGVLKEGVSTETGNSTDNSLSSRRSKGARCPRCGGEIRTIRIQQRSSYYCAKHQR